MSERLDLTMVDEHPYLMLVLGQAQSGKTTFMNYLQHAWHLVGPRGGKTLALDNVCPDPPKPKHLAAWSTYWTYEAPASIPQDVSMVLCDESSVYLSSSARQSPVLHEVARRGQHINGGVGVSAVLGSQRLTDFPDDIRAQANRVVIFRTISNNDVEWLGKNLPGITRQHMQMLRVLPPGYGIVWDQRLGVFTPYVEAWDRQREAV